MQMENITFIGTLVNFSLIPCAVLLSSRISFPNILVILLIPSILQYSSFKSNNLTQMEVEAKYSLLKTVRTFHFFRIVYGPLFMTELQSSSWGNFIKKMKPSVLY